MVDLSKVGIVERAGVENSKGAKSDGVSCELGKKCIQGDE